MAKEELDRLPSILPLFLPGSARTNVKGGNMDRRTFLNVSATAAAAVAMLQVAKAAPDKGLEAPPIDPAWRKFEVVTAVEFAPEDVPAKVWLPLPQYRDTDYQRTLDIRWTRQPDTDRNLSGSEIRCPAFFARWEERDAPPTLQVTFLVATRNRHIDTTKPGRCTTSRARNSTCICSRRRTFLPTASCARLRPASCQLPAQARSSARVRSMSGSSRTPTATRRLWAAAPATSASCSNPGISAASARI